MGAPQIILLVLFCISAVVQLGADGEPKEGNHSFVGWALKTGIFISLLAWGGFFNHQLMIYGSLGEGEEALINKCARIANDADCGTEEHGRAVKTLLFYSNKIKKLREIRRNDEQFGNYHEVPYSVIDWKEEH